MASLRHPRQDGAGNLRGRIVGIVLILIFANLCVWAWALISFRAFPLLLGTAFLAYSLGLRHAFDADHIAAIDNVTRKMMQEGKRPATIGLFFSLGHSTIVVLASVAVALTAAAFKDQLEFLHGVGGAVGTIVSALFLFAIALANAIVLAGIYRAFRKARSGGDPDGAALTLLPVSGGVFARLFRSLFRGIGRSWHMYPLGLLFGLGFDTATEIGLLGISAAEASRGLPIWTILVFPALFTAGMTLVDTADSILMLGAYGWAFVKPIRKLYYNMTITFVSVIVALVVGGIEALGLIGDQLGLEGAFWEAIGALNDNFGTLGYVIVGIFVVSWIASLAIYRLKGYDALEAGASAAGR